MPNENTLSNAISEFSQKLSRFNKADISKVKITPSESTRFEEALNARNEKLKNAVAATYKIYKSPFEALGAKSNRADAIVKDEENLFAAYTIYKACIESQKAFTETCPKTFIKTLDIHSPLTEKANYTSGGQLIYIIAWLFYEKKCSDYVPYFVQKEDENNPATTHYCLTFEKTEDFSMEDRNKEILEIIKKEFYGE